MKGRHYNRAKKRWERAMPCGRVIWTRRRHRLGYNVALHVGRCRLCQLHHGFRFCDEKPRPILAFHFRFVFDSRSMAVVGFGEKL